MISASRLWPTPDAARRGTALLALAFALAGGVFFVVTRLATPSLFLVGAGTIGAVVLWMFSSEHLGWPAVILAVYLGALDGYLKLSTGSTQVTLVRDLLLYSILAGVLARAALRQQKLELPPLSGWVLLYVVIVLVQLLNPADIGLKHSLAALRPHLEFVPLFFFGYHLVQTPARLRRFFVVLLVCATANGVVSFIQFNLTPEQLAGWGPGYAQRINGTGDVSGRFFTDNAGDRKVRPFGLGADAGSGAAVGLLSLGAALALLTLGVRSAESRWALLLCLGPPLAIITGQSRTSVVAAFAALVFFLVIATSAKRLASTLAGVALGIVVAFGAISLVASSSVGGVFDRYKTIAPDKLAQTTQKSRGSSLAVIPKYIVDHPLGAGIGSVGPASGFAGGGNAELNGETQPTFFLVEIGVPGLVLMFLFNLKLLGSALRTARRLDPRDRALVAGLAAGVAALFLTWLSGPSTATSPTSPFFWFAAGALAFWTTRPAADARF